MLIRRSTYEDLPRLMQIFAEARQIMRESGNLTQWPDTYPSEATIIHDICNGHSYVCCSENGTVEGTFACIPGPDPTYAVIYDGEWPDNDPYLVIHRIAASKDSGGGIAAACFRWAFEGTDTIRIDTHKDNVIMHHILQKNGFTRCGIIHLADGAPRVAYCKKRN